jgi:hypothetical protein
LPVVCRSHADQDAAADSAPVVPAKEFGRTGKTLSRERYSGCHTPTEGWTVVDPPSEQADEEPPSAGGDACLADLERLRANGQPAKEGLIDDALRTGWLRERWNHHDDENQESRARHRPTILAAVALPNALSESTVPAKKDMPGSLLRAGLRRSVMRPGFVSDPRVELTAAPGNEEVALEDERLSPGALHFHDVRVEQVEVGYPAAAELPATDVFNACSRRGTGSRDRFAKAARRNSPELKRSTSRARRG